ncbi:MAG TPA: hypothetical protein VIK84_00700 [Haloplasmataceae bacterium]
MKTINDFKIIDGVAILEGVAYAEEAKVVDEYLKNNPNIKYASVYTFDNRYFELKNGRLLSTNEKTFVNPYYEVSNDTIIFENNGIDLHELERRILAIESALLVLYKELQSYIDKMTNK